MSLLTDKSTTHSDPVARIATAPDASRGERTTSWDPAFYPVPTGREEAWRFTPIRELSELLDAPEFTAASVTVSGLPKGGSVEAISAEQVRTSGAPTPSERGAALAAAQGAHRIVIPANVEGGEPITVAIKSEALSAANVLIEVGTHSQVTIVLEHTGSGKLAELISLIAADGAQVSFIASNLHEADGVLLAEHNVLVGRDASVRHTAISLGGALVRICTNAAYSGPGGSFDGQGVYFAESQQHLEHRLFVDHEAPNCRSNVEYKGALSGSTAHTVWVGDVLIRAAAEGTLTYELNRNLVLTDGARADSVPNLEIETGEIEGAGHASTTGRFDDEQLFYLQSRGIPEAVARQLVVRGFFAAIVNRIGVESLITQVTQALEAKLERAQV